MVEKRGNTYVINDRDGEVETYRDVQALWRAQNEAWRLKTLAAMRLRAPAQRRPT